MKALKTQVSRRGVIRGFGAGAIAGIGKGMGSAGKMVGINQAAGLGSDGNCPSVAHAGSNTGESISSVLRKLGGIPDFRINEMRRSARYVTALDADIGSYKSVSMSARILMQRERNFEQRKREFYENYTGEDVEKERAFLKRYGLDWF